MFLSFIFAVLEPAEKVLIAGIFMKMGTIGPVMKLTVIRLRTRSLSIAFSFLRVLFDMAWR